MWHPREGMIVDDSGVIDLLKFENICNAYFFSLIILKSTSMMHALKQESNLSDEKKIIFIL